MSKYSYSNEQISCQSHAGGSVIYAPGGYTGLSYILDTSKANKCPNTAIQMSKYHANPKL